MGDDGEFEDELFVEDEELTTFEKHFFAAIRESHKLDAEIDDEYRQLASGEYREPSIPESGADDDGDQRPAQ